jgi:hypothetical protein
MNASRPDRPGYALLAVIATLVVAELLVLGLWRVGVAAMSAARESATHASARIEAESALRKAVAEWDELAVSQQGSGIWYLVPGASQRVGSVSTTVEALGLFRGTRLLRSTVMVTANGRVRTRLSAEASLSAVPIDELWRDFHSAIVAGGDVRIATGDTIDGSNSSIPAAWTPAECPLASTSGARPGLALASGAGTIGAGAAVTGAPPVLSGAARAAPADFDRIGGILAPDFDAIADRLEHGSVTLSPASAGTTCDTAIRGNWGEPAITGHPCHDYFPIIHAGSDLDIVSGAGQGILIVDGTLRIAAGVRFYGAILVRGPIEAAGAEIHGSVRIAGAGTASRLGGTFRYEDCALSRAFRLAPGLRRLYRVSDRWWLPTF